MMKTAVLRTAVFVFYLTIGARVAACSNIDTLAGKKYHIPTESGPQAKIAQRNHLIYH
jgi:hypothetical protein